MSRRDIQSIASHRFHKSKWTRCDGLQGSLPPRMQSAVLVSSCRSASKIQRQTFDPLDRTAVHWAWRQFWLGCSGAPRPARRLLKCVRMGKTWGAEHGETVSLCATTVDPPTRQQEARGDRIGSLKNHESFDPSRRPCPAASAVCHRRCRRRPGRGRHRLAGSRRSCPGGTRPDPRRHRGPPPGLRGVMTLAR